MRKCMCCVLSLLVLALLTACQGKAVSIPLPDSQGLAQYESVIAQDLEQVLETLGLEEGDLTRPDVGGADLPGYWMTNRRVEIEGHPFQERLNINYEAGGDESYGLNAYGFVCEEFADEEEFAQAMEAAYNSLLELYGEPEATGGAGQPDQDKWDALAAGEEGTFGCSWRADELTLLSFYAVRAQDVTRIEMTYQCPELYETRMVNMGRMDREDALFYLEGQE